MKEYKLSPWHDGSVKPVNKGVYKVKCGCYECEGKKEWYSKWNGEVFCFLKDTIEQANNVNAEDDLLDKFKWRGILKD